MTSIDSLETFPALAGIDGLSHGFVLRDPHTDVDSNDREKVLRRLQPYYRRTLARQGADFDQIALAEQVHGDGVAVIDGDAGDRDVAVAEGMDGLVTATPGLTLGIYVADCCAVFLVDPNRRACGLVHSGRRGSELGIALAAIKRMKTSYGSEPSDIRVVLSPCIRPPAYEVDIAAMIRRDCAAAGVPASQIHDAGTDTSADLERYYSYRQEKGHTGRMLAFVAWRQEAENESP